jgi:ABC-type multidrug transport system fused ATPase/permease subunit
MLNLLTDIHKLIPGQYRRKILPMVLLLVVGSLLDFFSLATFIPVLLLIVDPQSTYTFVWIRDISRLVSVSDPSQIAICFTVLAVVFMLVKTVIQSWIVRRKAVYAYAIADSLASSALAYYLASSYSQFTNTDYSREMNRISNYPLTFANNVIIPLGTLVSEGLLTLALLTGVAIYNVQVVGLLALILMPVAWVYRLKRKRIRNISDQIKAMYPAVLKSTLQAVEALPEIKAFDKGSFFRRKFDEAYHQLTQTFSADHTTHAGTSRITELVAACCIGTLIIYALLDLRSGREVILLLSVFAGISFRVIPSVSRIFGGILQIRSHEYVIGDLRNMIAPEMHAVEAEVETAFPFRKSLELRDICFAYDEGQFVLRNITLTVRKGEKVIFVGKSGKGKTTLLLLLMRFLKETSGEIVVDGKVVTEADTSAWRKLLGYVPQHPYILDATILENIAFGVSAENIDAHKVGQLIRSLDLESWLSSLPLGLNTVIGEKGLRISGGQRQRLAIARALYHDAEILLLDEITSQLDRETEKEIVQLLDQLALQNKTIFFVTHRPELWKSVDTLYQIKNGSLEKLLVSEQSFNGS